MHIEVEPICWNSPRFRCVEMGSFYLVGHDAAWACRKHEKMCVMHEIEVFEHHGYNKCCIKCHMVFYVTVVTFLITLLLKCCL